jgi:hypothetical protein
MSTLAYNERAERYQALEGGHLIVIEEDVFMIEFHGLLDSGLSEAEALEELLDVQWWFDRLPKSGVFIDGIEQDDTETIV